MLSKWAFKLSVRWAILGAMLAYVITGIVSLLIWRTPVNNRLLLELYSGEGSSFWKQRFCNIPSISSLFSPLDVIFPISSLAFIGLNPDNLLARWGRRRNSQF